MFSRRGHEPCPQTSAYAEMDLGIGCRSTERRANLRICGDGPRGFSADVVPDRKPPHMRRWTPEEVFRLKQIAQTSAYAEMDPYECISDKLHAPNLRICGDGPDNSPAISLWHSKPPHMRRWTSWGVIPATPNWQTSAYAEMDPPSRATSASPSSNLRICGDGPLSTVEPCFFACKPPHMRRWTACRSPGRAGSGQTSAYAEMDRKRLFQR